MQEQQDSLGSYIRSEREKNNISLEQVAYATRISIKMLTALEEDDHAQLPAPTFVRGYLQAYAKYVRLDAQDLLLRYQHHLATQPGAKRTTLKSHYLYVKERYQEQKRVLLIVSLFFMLVVSAGTYFGLKHKRDKSKALSQQVKEMQQLSEEQQASAKAPVPVTAPAEKAPAAKEPIAKAPGIAAKEKDTQESAESKAASVTAEVKAQTAATPTPTPAASASPTPPSTPSVATSGPKKYHLLLKAGKDVWMRFQTDEEEVKDIMLREGKMVSLKANKVIKLFSGNLGALQATLNGHELKTLVAPNRAMSAVIPEEEIPHYPLPLFPLQAQRDKEAAKQAGNSSLSAPGAQQPTQSAKNANSPEKTDKTSSDN